MNTLLADTFNPTVPPHVETTGPAIDAQQLADMRRQLDQIEQHVRGGAPDAAERPATATVTSRRKRERTNPMSTVHTASGAPAPNVITIETLLERATDLGKQAGQGKDTQVKFDLVVAEAAYMGTLDLTAHKHGNEIDDATRMSAAYVKAQQGAVVFDTKAPNQRKTISNTRKMIKVGGLPKFGPGEPLQTLNNLVTMRQQLRKDPANAKRLDDAHNMVMKWATAQLKSDTLISDQNELRAFAFKPEVGHRDAESVLDSVRKTLNNLKLGKVANCPDQDTSTEVQAAITALNKRLAAIAKARAPSQSAPATV